ncbi:hypothetical protein HDU97_008941, partial [Phlyctochytrium planicorne]
MLNKTVSLRSVLLLVLLCIAAVTVVSVAAEGDASVAKGASKCPLAGKCPWKHEGDAPHGDGCPLKKGKCPYYEQHKGDANLADYLTAKGGK